MLREHSEIALYTITNWHRRIASERHCAITNEGAYHYAAEKERIRKGLDRLARRFDRVATDHEKQIALRPRTIAREDDCFLQITEAIRNACEILKQPTFTDDDSKGLMGLYGVMLNARSTAGSLPECDFVRAAHLVQIYTLIQNKDVEYPRGPDEGLEDN